MHVPNDIGIDYDMIIDKIYQLDIADNTFSPYYTSNYFFIFKSQG